MKTLGIEAAVKELIDKLNIKFAVQYMRETKRDDWPCDAWSVTIKDQQFDYFTGLGLRKADKKEAQRLERLNDIGKVRRKQLYEELLKPVKPTEASVLHSLILDIDGASEAFDDWCSQYGYDTDSRKAERIYFECQEHRKKVNSIFSLDTIAQLQELLQDY